MDYTFLKGFIERADKAWLRMRGVALYHDGVFVGEHNWLFDERRNIHSVSKSFTSIAVGMSQKAGCFNLSDPIATYFEDKLPSNPDERLLKITVEDLLTMRVGMKDAMNAEFRSCTIEDVARYYLSRPMANEPGAVFDYDTGATYMLAALIQRTTGLSVRDFLQAELFNPLGIENVTWPSCCRGITIGGSGLMLSTSEMARFGQFLLQKGEWKWRQIVPASYIDEASVAHTYTPAENTGIYGINEGRFENAVVEFPEVSATRPPRGYGYQFWTNIYPEKYPKAYYCMGSWGKWILIVPEKNAALSVCAHEQTVHGQMIIEKLMEEEILDKL